MKRLGHDTGYSIYFAENAIKHQPLVYAPDEPFVASDANAHKNALQIQLALIQSNLADL